MYVNIEVVEELLSGWNSNLGSDALAYKNHVYRIINICAELSDLSEDDFDKICIAACFHDVGIWLDNTFDYLNVSNVRCKNYLESIGKSEWYGEISQFISDHHKITQCSSSHSLAEVFRKSDWLDVTLGVVNFGISRSRIKEIQNTFPNSGFHLCLLKLFFKQLLVNPLKPIPVIKW